MELSMIAYRKIIRSMHYISTNLKLNTPLTAHYLPKLTANNPKRVPTLIHSTFKSMNVLLCLVFCIKVT